MRVNSNLNLEIWMIIALPMFLAKQMDRGNKGWGMAEAEGGGGRWRE